MRCDHGRCWRRAVAFVPDVGTKCSAHALADWKTWPAERLAEIESENSRRLLLREAA